MKRQLTTYRQRLGRLSFFSRLEAAELPKLLLPGEEVLGVISGFYTGGTALLCATSKRLLLIDKKLTRLSVEDVRYDAIRDICFSQQFFMASIKLFVGREMQFLSWYRRDLREIAHYIEQRMFEASGQSSITASLTPQLTPQVVSNTGLTNSKRAIGQIENPQFEQYLQERIARWRKATRFIESLPSVSSRPRLPAETTH